MTKFGTCRHCKNPYIGPDHWQNCHSKRFQQVFDKWTSGNKHIDKFIQEAQLKARRREGAIKWIPYNRLSNIEYLTRGGFSTIYKATLRYGSFKYSIILKSLNNSSNINEDFLNEVSYFIMILM